MSAPQTVGVMLAAYNGERYIRRALGSIFAQTRAPDQVVVIEDGTNDGTRAIIEREFPKVRYEWQPNGGPPSAYNTGFALLTTDYVASLDQDDAWLPQKLERQLDVFRRYPNAQVVLCQAVGRERRPVARGTVREARFRDWFTRDAFAWTDCSMSGWMLKRALFDTQLHRFEASARSFMDYEALLRVCALGHEVLVLREELYERDMHETSFGHSSAGQKAEARELPRVMERYAPGTEGWPGARLTPSDYATAMKYSLRRYIGWAVRWGDDAWAREMIDRASALRGGRIDLDVELRIARRAPGAYLALRRLLTR